VGRDDGYFDDVHWLDDGTVEELSTGSTPPRLPWPRWFTLTLAALVVAGAVAAINHVRNSPPATPAAAGASTPASRPAPRVSLPGTTPSPATSVTVTPLGHPLFGASTGWELIARGTRVLVRIQPAAGRIIQTTIPDLNSGGPVSLLTGSDRVIIRPLDHVPGYLVPDGKPARVLPAQLNLDGPVFPGPAPGQMWVRPADDHQPVMALATLDGRRLADFVPVPTGSSSFEAVSDGAGYLLYPSIGGVYQARPGGLRRISTGALLAVGPTGWLVVECDEQYRCQQVLVNRLDGSRRTVSTATVNQPRTGIISPDGATAAMLTNSSNGTSGLYLLDLKSGNRKLIGVSANLESFDGITAFSPDSRWLFVITVDGSIAVVNRATGAVSTLEGSLPPLTQLVVRPAGRDTATSLAAVAQALTPTCCRPIPGL